MKQIIEKNKRKKGRRNKKQNLVKDKNKIKNPGMKEGNEWVDFSKLKFAFLRALQQLRVGQAAGIGRTLALGLQH